MPDEMGTGVDRRALRILFDTYWTSSGWRDNKDRFTPLEDLEYAKRVGVMFDEVHFSHDDTVERALSAVRAVNQRDVANAFVASLSSQRLELRSALGSFAVLRHLPRHDSPTERSGCRICGLHNRTRAPEDLNVLNFERFKWGGVRHDQPFYAAMDLELFARFTTPAPGADDVRLLRTILSAIEAVPSKTTSASLEKHLAKLFKSNKPERDALVGILGLCGILGTVDHPGYLRQFIPSSARELPARRFVDMKYPACWWTRADGLHQEAVIHWFGHLL